MVAISSSDARRASRLSSPPPPQHQPTVVVIDDSPTALGTVTHWLEDEGLHVIPLSRALGATTTLMRVQPAVLLLDIQLPGLSGDRFAGLLSRNPATAGIPIIFYSQIDVDELKRLAHECAVVGAIAKSPSQSQFLREFEKLAGPFLKRAPEGSAAQSSKREYDLPSFGVAELDEQHRRIRTLVQALAVHLRDVRRGDESFKMRRTLRDTILELLVYMRFHLATEERLLREKDDVAVIEHRAEHNTFLDEAAKIERALDRELSATELAECGQPLRLLVLDHMWRIDVDERAKNK